MPIEFIRKESEILAAGGTVSFDSTELVDQYIIVSTGAVTLLANQAFTYTGAISAGMLFKFEYTANIDAGANTITFFGETMPDSLTDKECEITAYYNGTTWDVKFIPSINEIAIITPAQFTISPYILLDYTAGGTSTAVLTEETLASIEFSAADAFSAIGDTVKILIGGRTAANADQKVIRIKSNELNRVNPQVVHILNTVTTTPNGLDFKAEVTITRVSATNVVTNSYIQFNGIAAQIDTVASTGAYDFAAGATTFKYIATSQLGTATAGDVVIDSMIAYKIVA